MIGRCRKSVALWIGFWSVGNVHAEPTTVVTSPSDKVGNRLQMVIRMVGHTPSCTTTVEYQYDTLDRLTQETRTVILAAGEFDDGRHYAVNFADGTQQLVAAPPRQPENPIDETKERP